MYIGTHAQQTPDKPAVIMTGSGEQLTYAQLDEQSSRLARALLDRGLQRGDRIVLVMENRLEFLVIAWAAFRSGMEVATPSRYANADDLAYILNDSQAQAFFTSELLLEVGRELPALASHCKLWVRVGGMPDGWIDYADLLAQPQRLAPENEWMGHVLNYTSGTTGRPRGVLRAFPPLKAWETWPKVNELEKPFQLSSDAVFLSPAPLYHGAPMLYVRAMHCLGATVVIMEKFEPHEALHAIESHEVTHSQWVPTMFTRMLKLPAAEREGFDLSRHAVAIHAAAPCPVDVKHQMITWWGPILYEYYGATDGANQAMLDSHQWLQHPGSVGAAPPTAVRICDDEGAELPEGQIGLIYLVARTEAPSYLNDPEKTKASRHPRHEHWMTVGDVGYVKEGYLFLTDRKSYTIISGGVNIYPQAIEDALVAHPAVLDAAVFGVPNPDMGEEVKAVVQLVPGQQGSTELAEVLRAHCATRMSKFMVPRSVDFVEALPRTPTGKLLKRVLKEAYTGAAANAAA